MEQTRCVVCGISSVPLMLGLDGKYHCANCSSTLIADTTDTTTPIEPEQPEEEEEHHG